MLELEAGGELGALLDFAGVDGVDELPPPPPQARRAQDVSMIDAILVNIFCL